MCRKNITNIDNFVYLARYNPNDPYDLKIVEYGKIYRKYALIYARPESDADGSSTNVLT